jgi:thiol-disulfide isomerase/thioredoxin
MKKNIGTPRSITFLSCLFFLNVSFGQMKEEERAPEIQYNTSFPKEYKLPVKKAILLDFWATWCAPCIKGMKETNEWVPEYSSQIDFLCITDHTSKDVEQFIKKGKFNHIFLVDTTNQTSRKFGVESLPTTFLIDTNGVIVWRGLTINKSILDEFLKTGKVLNQSKTESISMGDAADNNFIKTAEDQIGGPSFAGMGGKGDSIKYFFKNRSLEEIIELLYNKPKQVIFNQKSFSTHYDLQVYKRNVNRATVNLQILDEISKIVPFSYKIETRDTLITELVVINEDLLYSNRTQYDSLLGKNDNHSFDFEYNKEKVQLLSAENISLNEFTAQLAIFFKKLIITNTIIQERFNFEKIPISDYNQFFDILIKKYGLALKMTYTKIPFLIIDK